MNVSYDNLPNAIGEILKRLDNLQKTVTDSAHAPQPDRWMTIDELCDYLPEKPAKQTIYGLVSRGKIPVSKRSKRLLFLKSLIDEWLRSASRVSLSDVEQRKGA